MYANSRHYIVLHRQVHHNCHPLCRFLMDPDYKLIAQSLVQAFGQSGLSGHYELHSGVGLRIHFSGYRGQYTQTGRSMNQADHPQILLFEIGRIHRFVVYKASIHKYSQLGNSHHQSIAPLKVCCKFNIKKLKIVKWRFDQNGPTAFVELDLESEGQTFFCFFIFLHWTWLQPKPPSWRWIPHSSLFLYLKGFIHAFWTGFRLTLILLYDIHVCEHCITDIVW